MTDNDIKKALESYKKDISCGKCGYKDQYLLTVITSVLDLINRLEAENRSLKYDYDNLQRQFDEIYQQFHYLSNVEIPYLYSFTEDKEKKLETIANILLRTKSEAYKEFADKVKKLPYYPSYTNLHKAVDNLLKEMVGE